MSNTLRISDKLILSPIWLLTLLPLRILYVFSDFVFLILYYLIRYRRGVVDENLQNAFPEKSEEERKRIARKFYRNLCDIFIESVYTMNMSVEKCNERYTYKNREVIEKLKREKRNIILATSHYGNWEWLANFPANFDYVFYGVYKPLSNKVIDRLFIHLRERYGAVATPMKHTLRAAATSLQKKEEFALLFISDQRPGMDDLNFWTPFLNQEAPVITGMDKLGRRYDLAVVFMQLRRVRRGYYEITLENIVDNPKETQPYEIAEKYIRKVEQQVQNCPEFYLWTHKRWKYKAAEFKKTN